MAYSLRPRVREVMLEESRENDFGGDATSDSDNVSEQSESDSEDDASDYSEAKDAENETLSARILQQRQQANARGRPSTILFSKNKTKWSTKPCERTSGK
ncbi:hypothetical protein HHI36_000657 [Cryptolaemus montrouzieri]|uniref:Uncharacterized protein n=1 Tax=Cryptolaemus montrouzieri TaxID=559131 RepID=A0ABD2P6P1_9CUCU